MTDQPVALDADDAESFAFHGDFAVAGLSMQRERAFSDLELDDNLNKVVAILEPALLVVMGVIIAVMLLAMYMPIFEMQGAIR